jgi:hypothetical protein
MWEMRSDIFYNLGTGCNSEKWANTCFTILEAS